MEEQCALNLCPSTFGTGYVDRHRGLTHFLWRGDFRLLLLKVRLLLWISHPCSCRFIQVFMCGKAQRTRTADAIFQHTNVTWNKETHTCFPRLYFGSRGVCERFQTPELVSSKSSLNLCPVKEKKCDIFTAMGHDSHGVPSPLLSLLRNFNVECEKDGSEALS